LFSTTNFFRDVFSATAVAGQLQCVCYVSGVGGSPLSDAMAAAAAAAGTSDGWLSSNALPVSQQ